MRTKEGVAAIIGMRHPSVAQTLSGYLAKLEVPFITTSMVTADIGKRVRQLGDQGQLIFTEIYSHGNQQVNSIKTDSGKKFEIQMRPDIGNAIIDLINYHLNWQAFSVDSISDSYN